MTLSSMTGFSRVDGEHEGRRWCWEIKSVNGRGLELRCRLPQGLDAIEPDLRAAAKEQLHRGSVNVGLSMRTDEGETQYRVNEAALSDALLMIGRIRENLECAPPRAEGVLALRGVVEAVEKTQEEETRKALSAALLASFRQALGALVAARRAEGAAMATVLAAQFDEVAQLTKEASALASASPATIKQKIAAQLTELLAGAQIPEERLTQEAALLALKADIREELDRLRSHLAAGRALLAQNGPIGRQLDFLTQEFNREANTLCSKASDMDLKRIGLALKKVIDQMREQVQNVE